MDRERRVFINRSSRENTLLLKENNLKEYLFKLNKKGKITLAFSGGIDSGFLAYLSSKLGLDFETITFIGFNLTDKEYFLIKKWCDKYNIINKFVFSNPIRNKEFILNEKNRCYLCKKYMYENLKKEILIDGTNFSDLKEYRPGIKALEESNVLSPYIYCKIEKKDILYFCKKYGLKYFSFKSRSCLFTRFNYNYEIVPFVLFKIRSIENIFLVLKINDFRVRVIDNNKIIVQVAFSEYNKFFRFYFLLKNKIKSIFIDKIIYFYFLNKVSGYFDKKNKGI